MFVDFALVLCKKSVKKFHVDHFFQLLCSVDLAKGLRVNPMTTQSGYT
jgi:hypothetical protein